jgi:hypothetical protein
LADIRIASAMRMQPMTIRTTLMGFVLGAA